VDVAGLREGGTVHGQADVAGLEAGGRRVDRGRRERPVVDRPGGVDLAGDDVLRSPKVSTAEAPVAVAAADRSTVVALVKAAMVVPSGMFVPVALRPTSAAVKLAVADVIVTDAFVVAPSATERVLALSILNDCGDACAVVTATFKVAVAPTIDLTKVRAARPGPEIDRFTNVLRSAVELVIVNVVPEVVPVTVRAAPLWYCTLLKSWIVNFDDTKFGFASTSPVLALKTHATRRALWLPGHAG
jgi:hypothetical protein